MNAVCLLSGGIDGLVAAALVQRREQARLVGLHFKRERKEFELVYARRCADWLSIPLKVVPSDITQLIRDSQEMRLMYELSNGQTWEFLLGRNLIYLTLAFNFALSISAEAIIVGYGPWDAPLIQPPTAVDFPDCHLSVIRSFEDVLNACVHRSVSTRRISLLAPLADVCESKKDVFKLAVEFGIPLEITLTCYTPKRINDEWIPCGECPACRAREEALKEVLSGESTLS